MQPITTSPILTNPYVPHHGFSLLGTEMLLLCALALLVVGFLLVEKRALERVEQLIDNAFAPKRPRTIRPI